MTDSLILLKNPLTYSLWGTLGGFLHQSHRYNNVKDNDDNDGKTSKERESSRIIATNLIHSVLKVLRNYIQYRSSNNLFSLLSSFQYTYLQ